MTTALSRSVVLTPTGDRSPVERAVVTGIADDFDPETFLWIVFNRPDGGATVWYAWTAGGPQLGDQTDQHAVAAGLDGADWLHITGRHVEESERGRVKVQAHLLRPILADVHGGARAPADLRHKLARFSAEYATRAGGPRRFRAPWLGVGPASYGRWSA